jgi:nitroreductase
MAVLNASDVLSQLAWRYAVKKFDPARKISSSDWKALEQSLVLSPSSFGLQPWKFLVIESMSLRQKLLPVSWNQSQVVDASHVVVFLIRKDLNATDVDRLIQATASARDITADSLAGFRSMMLKFIQSPVLDVNAWADRQVYIALGTFMTTAAMMGIDTCPMEGIVPAQYDEILGLTGSGYATSVVATAGYRAVDDKYAQLAKVRYSTNEVVEYR